MRNPNSSCLAWGGPSSDGIAFYQNQTLWNIYLLKGIVYPKILSSCIHPQVVPNLYECLCSAEHKGRYSEDILLPGCFGAPLTSIVGKTILWKSMVPYNCSVKINGLASTTFSLEQKSGLTFERNKDLTFIVIIIDIN